MKQLLRRNTSRNLLTMSVYLNRYFQKRHKPSFNTIFFILIKRIKYTEYIYMSHSKR